MLFRSVRKRQDRDVVSDVEVEDIYEGDRAYKGDNGEDDSYAED